MQILKLIIIIEMVAFLPQMPWIYKEVMAIVLSKLGQFQATKLPGKRGVGCTTPFQNTVRTISGIS